VIDEDAGCHLDGWNRAACTPQDLEIYIFRAVASCLGLGLEQVNTMLCMEAGKAARLINMHSMVDRSQASAQSALLRLRQSPQFY